MDDDCGIIDTIRTMYMLAILVWIIILILIKVYTHDIVVWLMALVPIVLFIINYINLPCTIHQSSDHLLRGDFVAMAYLIAIVIIAWGKKGSFSSISQYVGILIGSVILITLSMLDFWVDTTHIVVTIHVKIVLQTMAITLLTIGVYLYFISMRSADGCITPTSVQSGMM